MMNVQYLIDIINEYDKNEQWFWVAGFAKETYPILKDHLDELREVARQAVEHYTETEGK